MARADAKAADPGFPGVLDALGRGIASTPSGASSGWTGNSGPGGWGGECFAAACAINRALFGDRGTLVAALNGQLAAVGIKIGHPGVRAIHVVRILIL